jgi:hypothetical protein
MALMGFVSGALSDVVKRREQSRLEAADARKEARLAAIRAEERSQEFAQRRELTQYELGERRAMAAEELAGRTQLQTDEIAARERINAADNAARAAEAAADRKSRERVANIGASAPRDRSARFETFVDDSGKPYTFDANDPADVQRFKATAQQTNLRPDYASRRTQPAPSTSAPAPSAPPPQASGPSRIASQSEYARLPSGTRYVAPDGSVRVKP